MTLLWKTEKKKMGKRERDTLEDYFLAKFKDMGIEIIPPIKRRLKTTSANESIR